MSDEVCRWHGCNRRITDKSLRVKIQPRGFVYHWACARDLVNNGELDLYCDDISCADREAKQLIAAANKADKEIAKIKRRDGNFTTRR